MKKRSINSTRLAYALAFISLLFSSSFVAQTNFTVNQCSTEAEAIALVDTVLLHNVGATFKENITITGDPGAIGYFSGGELFGFVESEGIIMSSGFAGSIEGANTCIGSTSGNTTGGSDQDLSMLSSQSINDACIIEFDLMLPNDSVFLSYVFGSEEYHEWVNTAFNDVFGFFVSGPGISGVYSNNAVNIAVIPGTTMNVGISTLNCGNVADGCNPPPGTGPNCALLHNNKDPMEDSFQECKLDAYSLQLITEQEIQSYEWYHFKLAIGDAADASMDSGVLFEKGSIVSIPIPTMNMAECENEQDVLDYVDNVLLSEVLEDNKANIVFQGDPRAIGYYNNTDFLKLEQNSGLFLSNGQASNAVLSNECNKTSNASFNNDGMNTDQDLEILTGNLEVRDVSVIEFDYKPSADSIWFNYVYASEEYHALIDAGYFDVFGIFLSGPGIAGEFSNDAVNLAVLSEDNSPVNSSTINFGPGGLTCQGKPDDCYHCEYLIDNSQKTDTAFFAMAYDGYTVSLDATYPVVPGEWYHIKIAIADALTENHDSGIFLSEGTLVSDSLMTSVRNVSLDEKFRINPNPANEYIEVESFDNSQVLEYAIYDVAGQLLERNAFDHFRISLSNYPKGMLILELKTNDGVFRQKFLHQ